MRVCAHEPENTTLKPVGTDLGAPTWEQWCAKLANLLIVGDIKTFTPDELATASAWLRE